ncbi:hypothetical protein ANCCEY_01378 [Ancylostoma ceylanicum]|uniref:Uncharacterized protein n=1 Tax=Ancylostoma ceylanicum TaxID=53326 RepID=A0A0D6M7U8_9BILA|nr:hypothetical protein ANCCEY_01378 [Ancylostoma ceylanicum]
MAAAGAQQPAQGDQNFDYMFKFLKIAGKIRHKKRRTGIAALAFSDDVCVGIDFRGDLPRI